MAASGCTRFPPRSGPWSGRPRVTRLGTGRPVAKTDSLQPRRGRGNQGQATVEFALALPVVALALLLVIQVGLVARAQLLVAHAAREGARAAAVEGPAAAAPAARRAPGLRPERMVVSTAGGRPGGLVTVTVRYRAPTEAPLVGLVLGDPTLEANVTMRVEDRVEDVFGDGP